MVTATHAPATTDLTITRKRGGAIVERGAFCDTHTEQLIRHADRSRYTVRRVPLSAQQARETPCEFCHPAEVV